MKDIFSGYHPLINFTYFAAVIIFSMFFMHPLTLVISVAMALAYSVYLNGRKAIKFNLLFLLPSILMIALLNPLFNHEGVTILFYFRDNPITKESIIYGIATGLMFASVILWFSCYNAVMTSDKFIYLFGRIIPALSLIFSIVLRFVPTFKAQIRRISDAQKCIGRDTGSGTYMQRVRHGTKILSVMTTWALENAVETADSMKSRGYGLAGRTHFSIFSFDARDKGLLIVMLTAILVLLAGAVNGLCDMQYFPSIVGNRISSLESCLYLIYLLFCAMPLILNFAEEYKWKHLR